MNKEEIIDFLRNNKKTFEEQFYVTKIGLFGSYARDEAQDSSDIDIVIEAKIHKFKNRMALKYFLEEHFQKKVDVVYLDTMRSLIRKHIENQIIYA